MAGKPQNRRELRRQYDAAEPLDPMEEEAEDIIEDVDDEDAGERRPKKRAKAATKSKAKTPKAAKPAARMRIVWQVMNDAFKPLATFEFSQKEAAEARARELTEKKGGSHFVHKVKEPMPDDAPGLGAAIPRPVVTEKPIPAKIAAAAAALEDDEETDDEDDVDVDFEEDDVDDDE